MFRTREFIFRKAVVCTLNGTAYFTCIVLSSLVGRKVCLILYRRWTFGFETLTVQDIKIKNWNKNLENVHFVGLCCIIIQGEA
jgi:hypothetical protein